MSVPVSNFVNVIVRIAQQGVIRKNFSLPLFISDKVAFKTTGNATPAKVGLFSNASELASALSYDGVEVTDKSAVYIAAQQFKADGLDKFLVGDISQAADSSLDIGTSLDKIKLEQDFFFVVSPDRSETSVIAIAKWAEANEVFYFTSTNDNAVLSTKYVASGASETTDIASKLLEAGYNNTSLIYSADIGNFPEARWIGSRAIEIPGDSIWAYANLSGIAPDDLSPNQYENLLSKNCNAYILTGGKRITAPGKVVSGEWIDKIIEKFYIKAQVQQELFDLITTRKKIPYTEAGIALIANRFNTVLNSLSRNIIDKYQVDIPTIADLSPSVLQSRELTISAVATLKGAIQTASFKIDLTVGDLFNG